MLFLAVVLVVGLAGGYHASTAAAPEQPAVPPPSAGYTAKAAAAAAVLSRQSAAAYTRTHLWQAASALGATIDFMRASGSRAVRANRGREASPSGRSRYAIANVRRLSA